MSVRKPKQYTQKARTNLISAETSMTLKIRDNYFKVSAKEERSVPEDDTVDMDKEWAFLFDSINTVVDQQMAEIIDYYKK